MADRDQAATILDGKGHILRNTTIVVEGTRIARIGGAVPADAVTYDLTGLTVMPGLIDTHTHIVYHFGPDGRYAGGGERPRRATLYDVDNAVATLEAGSRRFRARRDGGQEPARAIARGIIPARASSRRSTRSTERSGPPDKLREQGARAEGAGRRLHQALRLGDIREGGEQTMTDEQIPAVCGEAKSLGLRTIVHAHRAESAKAATLAAAPQSSTACLSPTRCSTLMAEHGTYLRPERRPRAAELHREQGEVYRHRQLQRRGFASMEKGDPVSPRDVQEGAGDTS